jgi:hypothetical protein
MIFVDIKYIHAISPRLDKFHKVRDYLYNLRCPYCGDSEKFKNKARGYFYRVKDQMNFRCHNCDYGTTAGNVVKYIDPETYKEYVKESFFPTENEIEYKFEEPKFKKRDPKLKDLVPINKLNTDHPAHQVLVTRQIPEEHYDKFYLCHKFYAWSEISSNKDHPRLVIPFYDEDGKVFAAQGRAFGNEQPKYLTVKFDDKPKIFGLERVDFSKRVYVVEGPIDSLFLHNCLAVAGADFNNLQKEDTTIILDNEPRNKEIVRRMENLIDVDYELVIWPDSIQQKDINDMTLAGIGDIQTIIDNNTFSGLQAKMRLATWKRI